MSSNNFDDRNSTVRWIPRWARGFLGLNADYERPQFSRSGSDRQRMAQDGVSWVPSFVRSWLGLDFSEPKRYGPSDYDQEYRDQRTGYAPPPPPRPVAGYAPPPPPRPVAGYAPPPPLTPVERPAWATPQAAYTGRPVSPGANLPPSPEGYVQPIGYLLRAYARGALPPQGLENFTKEVRATSSDVWNLYSYWLRFQTEEFGRLARELMDAVADNDPTRPPASSTVRRIRVTTANDNVPVTGVGSAPPVAIDPAVAPLAAAAQRLKIETETQDLPPPPPPSDPTRE